MRLLSYLAGMFSLPRISAGALLLGAIGLCGGCLYDSSDRCDTGQKFDSASGLCLCAGNTVAGDHGCVACAENEIAQNDNCACAEGYQRASASSPCVVVPKGLGDACSSDQECADPIYSFCRIELDSGTSGYCTSSGCASSDDCAVSYACNTTSDPSFCERPPSGDGQACQSDADCAGTDATYCENHSSFVCYVEGCSLTANDCFPGKECCDLTGPSFGIIKKQICVDAGSCQK